MYVLQVKEGGLPTIQSTVGVCKITLYIVLIVSSCCLPIALAIAFHREVHSILSMPVK